MCKNILKYITLIAIPIFGFACYGVVISSIKNPLFFDNNILLTCKVIASIIVGFYLGFGGTGLAQIIIDKINKN